MSWQNQGKYTHRNTHADKKLPRSFLGRRPQSFPVLSSVNGLQCERIDPATRGKITDVCPQTTTTTATTTTATKTTTTTTRTKTTKTTKTVTTTQTTKTTKTTTTTTTTTTKTTPMADIGSAIFPLNGEVTAIKGWVQAGFAAFKGKAVKLVRCYSMAQSGDGGKSQGFHTACDNKGPTVTVVKTTKGWIFGGAADMSWASGNAHVASDSAFLFCVKCAGTNPGAEPSQL